MKTKDFKLTWPKLFKRCHYCGKLLITVPYQQKHVDEPQTAWKYVCRSCMSEMTDGHFC